MYECQVLLAWPLIDLRTGCSCDFDVFAGGLWSQHLKQYLLQNGIAVMEANNYVDDGWQSWSDEWSGGYDGAFFTSLAATMNEEDGPLAKLNPRKMFVPAVHCDYALLLVL